MTTRTMKPTGVQLGAAGYSVVLISVLALVAACSGSSSPANSQPSGPGVWATINVDMIPALGGVQAHTNVGAFAKDAAPLPDQFAVTKTVGDCKLLEPTSVTCSPTCSTTDTCVAKDTCQRTPASVAMGSLDLTGLELVAGGTAFTISPIATTYQAAGATQVKYPGCSAGQSVSVSGGADAATAFGLTTSCIDSMVVTGASPLPFESGKAAQFTWTRQSTGSARIAVRIDISHHGGLKGLVVCDAADSGSLQIDATLVSGLIALGTAGYPVAKLTRISSASAAAGSGKATLNIQSEVEVPLAIPGVVSCEDDSGCDTGQTCISLKCQ